MSNLVQAIAVAALSSTLAIFPTFSHGGPGHSDGHDDADVIEEMRDIHRDHDHGHDFEAVEEMSTEQAARMVNFMRDIGIALPPMNSERGRELFVQKGCVVCHSVNGVGIDIGPSLNAEDMPSPMNAFEFAARMWRGAPAMTAMQEAEFGSVIELSGQELADLIAFAHDAEEQEKLTADQVPENFRTRIEQ